MMTNQDLIALSLNKNEEHVHVPLSGIEIEQLRRQRETDEFAIADADDELKEAKEHHKAKVTPLKKSRATAFKEIRDKVRKEIQTVYEVDNDETGMIDRYIQGNDGFAIFISSRRALPRERDQFRITMVAERSGTNG